MMQLRSADGRAYNPARDIVNLFPRVIGYHAAVLLAKNRWPAAIKAYAESTGATEVDLEAASTALARFAALASHSSCGDISTIFVQSGMAALKPAALLAMMACVGQVTCSTYFQTLRNSIEAGRSVPGADGLADVAERVGHALRGNLPHVVDRRIEEAAQAALPSVADNFPQI